MQTVMNQTKANVLATLAQNHAKKCKKALTSDCGVCLGIIDEMGMIPLPMLSVAIQDVKTPALKTSIAALAIENLIDRTTHTGKRAKADSAAGMFYLKGYESRGGQL